MFIEDVSEDKAVLIIDYGVGNHLSVTKALDYLGYAYSVSNSVADIQNYQSYILPGVGAFSEAMQNITSLGIVDVLKHEVLVNKKPILGICLGMQLLADSSTEGGLHRGLELIEGVVEKIEPHNLNIKIPHVGWNEVIDHAENTLFSGIDSQSSFYFDHSYHFVCPENYILAKCQYGEKLISAVNKNNIYGFQFHPEKSFLSGLKLLRNYFNYIGCCHA